MAVLNNNYVKFMRGTKEAYQTLVSAGQISHDVLYFVYDSSDATRGVLYLGNKLIGGNDSEVAIPSSLSELSDVIFSALSDRQLLVYNGNAWINGTIESILDYDQNTFVFNNSKLSLVGFADAAVGTLPQKGADGKLAWVAPAELDSLKEVTQQIVNLNNNKADKADTYTKEEVTALIAAAEHLKRKFVDSVQDVDVAAKDAEQYIYLIPAKDSEDQDSYDEYMVVGGKVEKVGSWGVNLSDYVTNNQLTNALSNHVTTTQFNTTVGTLTAETISAVEDKADQNAKDIVTLFTFDSKVGNLDSLIVNDASYTTLVEQVNDLTMRLTWEDIPTV